MDTGLWTPQLQLLFPEFEEKLFFFFGEDDIPDFLLVVFSMLVI